MTLRIKRSTVFISLLFLFIIGAYFLLLNRFSAVLPQTQSGNLWAVFLTGLFTGGLTCLAVQGGLLATTIAQREENRLEHQAKSSGNALPIVSFLLAKLIAYTFLGFLLGLLGSFFQLSLTAQIIIQFAVIIFMLGTALNILNVHPIFRYFALQPPRFLTRMVRKQSKSNDVFAPALLGALTVFIPCGTTQAMMALAIGVGSPVMGAAILFAFVLGTSPLFFILGYYATKMGEALQQKFMRFAAVVLILLALFNLNNTLALTGNSFSLPRFFESSNASANETSQDSSLTERITTPVTEATIEFTQASYLPNFITVKAGSQVTLNLVNETGRGCVQAFTIPSLGIQKIVTTGSRDTIQFTAPESPGEIAFMCSMGMYQGVINVI
jgi:sulfite exporter TauE/SafE